jgi:anaerobic magnesium-protoporphyrin IX monomethyl ester cyclase
METPASRALPLKIALVRAPLISREGALNNEASPAIGLAYVAGYLLKKGHNVEIVDGTAADLGTVRALKEHPGFQVQGIGLDELVERIPSDADVIGFSSMFSCEWVLLKDLITRVRRRFPRALLVGGGEHFTALAEYSLRDCPALDVVVKGEGEYTFFELLEAWSAGGYSEVGGICYLDAAGSFRDNGGLPRIREVDSIPWPYWPEGYLERFWEAGKSYGVSSERDMPMIGSRGCPYKCKFCSSPQMWTTRYVLRDIDDLIAEIKHYRDKYGITSFQFYDLTVFTKKSWTLEFCRRLKQEDLGLAWSLPSGTRSEVLDEEILTLLRDTGCRYMAYAPESGSPRTLKLIDKKVDLDRMTSSVKIAVRLGLVCRTNLIIGFPHETRGDVWRTLWFGLRMAALGVEEVPFFIFSAYPGTEIFTQLRGEEKVTLDDAYFMSLVSFNGKFNFLKPQGTSNPNMTNFELAAVRVSFMLLNYFVGYATHPTRILRTLRNLIRGDRSSTVLENRLQDALGRKRHTDPAA